MEKLKKEKIEANDPKYKFDIITGDAGLNIDDSDLLILQKLDLAQFTLLNIMADTKTNCVIKSFLPFLRKVEESNNVSSFMISVLYLYYLSFDEIQLYKPLTSKPNSSEFYIIGKGFKKYFDDNDLINMLDNYKLNQSLFETFPDIFSVQAINFINKLIDLNIKDLGQLLDRSWKIKKNLTDDITVSINDSMGGFVQGEVWLRLRKISGYFNNTETLYFVDEYGNYINTESNQRITT